MQSTGSMYIVRNNQQDSCPTTSLLLLFLRFINATPRLMNLPSVQIILALIFIHLTDQDYRFSSGFILIVQCKDRQELDKKLQRQKLTDKLYFKLQSMTEVAPCINYPGLSTCYSGFGLILGIIPNFHRPLLGMQWSSQSCSKKQMKEHIMQINRIRLRKIKKKKIESKIYRKEAE